MIDESVVVNMLVLVGNHESVDVALSALTAESELQAVARHAVVQGYDVMAYAAVCLLIDIDIAHAVVQMMRLLHAIKLERRIGSDISLRHLSGKEPAFVGSMVAEKQLSLRSFVKNDEHTAVDHQIDIGTKNVYHLYGALHLHVARHINEQPVLGQHCVERSHGIGICAGDMGVIFCDEIGIFCGISVKRTHIYAFGKRRFGQQTAVESIIHHKIERRTEVRDIAAESVVRIHRNVQTVEIESIIRTEYPVDIGIFIFLHLTCGESETAEVVESLVAHGIESRRAVTEQRLTSRLVKVYILFLASHNHSSPISALIQS